MSEPATGSPEYGAGHWAELDPTIGYAILRLRISVFVIEQQCAYQELDGRDLDPSAVQMWARLGGEVVSTLRILRLDDGAFRIGRVATDPRCRGRGIAGELMRRALRAAGRPLVLSAQAHLVAWYETFGFAVSGPGWTEDGIPHVPMRVT